MYICIKSMVVISALVEKKYYTRQILGLMHDDVTSSNSPPSLVYANYSRVFITFVKFSRGIVIFIFAALGIRS